MQAGKQAGMQAGPAMDETARFARFAAVGVLGFLVDTGALYAAAGLGAGWLGGRLISYLVAASFTWMVNRRFTFRVAAPPSVREWLRFLSANGVGGLINYATYAALFVCVPLVAAWPVLGVAAGAVAGLMVNYLLSRHFVFRRP